MVSTSANATARGRRPPAIEAQEPEQALFQALGRQRLGELRDFVAREWRTGVGSLAAELEAPDLITADRTYWGVRVLAKVRRRLRDLEDLFITTERRPTYLTSSLFLHEACTRLTRDEKEDIAYITGHELGAFLSLDRIVTFRITRRGPCGVEGDAASTHEALIRLEEQGHRLLGWIHSHPGCGPEATSPSSTDLAHQERLEDGRYPVVGIIVTRDGHIRFFSRHRKVSVHIHGKGVTKLHEHIYHLQAPQDASTRSGFKRSARAEAD